MLEFQSTASNSTYTALKDTFKYNSYKIMMRLGLIEMIKDSWGILTDEVN